MSKAIAIFSKGDKVKFDIPVLIHANQCRSRGMTWLSDEYLSKAKTYKDQVGTVGQKFTNYQFNLTFPDGQTFHCKDSYVIPC